MSIHLLKPNVWNGWDMSGGPMYIKTSNDRNNGWEKTYGTTQAEVDGYNQIRPVKLCSRIRGK